MEQDVLEGCAAAEFAGECKVHGDVGGDGWEFLGEVAGKAGIPARTAQRYIADFCKSGVIHHERHDRYVKVVG